MFRKREFAIPAEVDRDRVESRAVELLLTCSDHGIKELAIDAMLGDYDSAEVYARELAHFITALGGLERRADRMVEIVRESD
jgi:hypothetical protein